MAPCIHVILSLSPNILSIALSSSSLIAKQLRTGGRQRRRSLSGVVRLASSLLPTCCQRSPLTPWTLKDRVILVILITSLIFGCRLVTGVNYVWRQSPRSCSTSGRVGNIWREESAAKFWREGNCTIHHPLATCHLPVIHRDHDGINGLLPRILPRRGRENYNLCVPSPMG
jgi:hypothetical protein